MAQSSGKFRSWIDGNDVVYDDISSRVVDGNVISVKNENGDTLLLKQTEIQDVLSNMIESVIESKNISLYRETVKGLTKHIDTNIEILEDESKNYFNDKIDKVAEDIAVRMMDSEIENEIKKRVEAKLEEMRKLL